MAEAVKTLPAHLVQITKRGTKIHPALATSYNRVLNTDFSRSFWHLSNEQDVLDTAHWCALGGSFLADFAMDPAKPRIFAWGLNPRRVASHYALKALKGRDADRIPTAACTLAEKVFSFLDTAQMPLTKQQIDDYFSLGPAGIRIIANDRVPGHYIHEALAQFIIPGTCSPYAGLIKKFLEVTGYPLMGVTSGNFSQKGKYRDRSGGTHKNLDEIQQNMGFLGIPILAGPIDIASAGTPSAADLYTRLHNPFLHLTDREKEDCRDLLPTSVTVVNPTPDGRVWNVVRHGSLHYSILQERLQKYGIDVVLDGGTRLDIGLY